MYCAVRRTGTSAPSLTASQSIEIASRLRTSGAQKPSRSKRRAIAFENTHPACRSGRPADLVLVDRVTLMAVSSRGLDQRPRKIEVFTEGLLGVRYRRIEGEKVRPSTDALARFAQLHRVVSCQLRGGVG
jgi:hypothetical protein